jgi:Tol biopolymer transport system component
MRKILTASLGALVLALGITGTGLAATPTTTLVDVSTSDDQADAQSYWPSVSEDGRYVAFVSDASNLDPGGSGIYVRDLTLNKTKLAVAGSTDPFDLGQPAISADGRFIAYYAANNVYRYDLTQDKTKLVSEDIHGNPAGGLSASPSISANGRYIAFSSSANNLTHLHPNARRNEFVRDMNTDKVQQVNVSSSGEPGKSDCHHPSISGDGRYVAFESNATNLVKGTRSWNIFVRDVKKQKTTLASPTRDGKNSAGAHNAYMSEDGDYVTFESKSAKLVKGDKNNAWDVFRRDLRAKKTTLVSVTSSGKQGDGDSRFSSLSNHGGFIAFESEATNLVKGDGNHEPDVFFRDLHAGKTVRVNVSTAGNEANAGTFGGESFGTTGTPSISEDGRFIGFDSQATTLVTPDNNLGASDVFLRGPLHG